MKLKMQVWHKPHTSSSQATACFCHNIDIAASLPYRAAYFAHPCTACLVQRTIFTLSACKSVVILAHFFPDTPGSDLVIVKPNPGKPVTGTPDSDLVIVKPDPADSPKQAAEKLVWSFLVLFENLVSARTLLKSLQEATLLVTPAPGQPALAKGTETSTAEAFVKKLQVGA